MGSMKIGVLICDDLHVGLETPVEHDLELFRSLLGDGFELAGWRMHAGECPPSPTACDGWVIGGSRASAFDDEPWIAALAGHVRAVVAARRPLIGICFGHQIVHFALGGTVARADAGWGLGLYPVAVGDDSGLDLPANLHLPTVHQDQVIRPAAGFRRLAGNDFCPWYLLRKDDVLTVQGHPEFDRPFYEEVLERVSTRAPADRVAAARRSLDGPNTVEPFRAALRQFLRGAAV